MNKPEHEENQPSDYTKFYHELLEEFGEGYIFTLEEFNKLLKETSFSKPNDVFNYLLHNNLIKSHKGGIELKIERAPVISKCKQVKPKPVYSTLTVHPFRRNKKRVQ
jgi:hypothetical protein